MENFIFDKIKLPSDELTLGRIRKIVPSREAYMSVESDDLTSMLSCEQFFVLGVQLRELRGSDHPVTPFKKWDSETPVGRDIEDRRADLADCYIQFGLAPGRQAANLLVQELESAIVNEINSKKVK